MILSNSRILEAIKLQLIRIGDLTGNEDPSKPPFNTSAVDLRLANEIVIPEPAGIAIDLSKKAETAPLLAKHSKQLTITKEQPFRLEPNRFILAKTRESVAFPINADAPSYSARVEGKSSLARWGIIVHFTAPTIHSNFDGTITLEIINLGVHPFLLSPDQLICQLIVEEVSPPIIVAPNQFKGQTTAVGL
jgi:dCTP deaminase